LIKVNYDKYNIDNEFKNYINITKIPTLICKNNNKTIFLIETSRYDTIINYIYSLDECIDF
jgi:hypothetical protein